MRGQRYKHIILNQSPDSYQYTTPSKGPSSRHIPERDRESHSSHLTRRFEEAWKQAEGERAVVQTGREGAYIEFVSDPGAELVTKSLEDLRSKKVRLLNVRTEEEDGKETTYATVYIASENRRHFLERIEAYATKETKKGKPRHADLINSIADVRKALLVESFWQDDRDQIPGTRKEWCEVWLSSDSEIIRGPFMEVLERERIESASGFLTFPERTVMAVKANRQDLERLSQVSDSIAEYRRVKETSAFWLNMENREQVDWVEDLVQRIKVKDSPGVSLCVLDTGINNGHPLLAPVLSDADCLTVDEHWGAHDHEGHGTLMAGVAAFGDLRQHLIASEPIVLKHCLESVKILPPPPQENPRELWGHVTAQGVSRAEIQGLRGESARCAWRSHRETLETKVDPVHGLAAWTS